MAERTLTFFSFIFSKQKKGALEFNLGYNFTFRITMETNLLYILWGSLWFSLTEIERCTLNNWFWSHYSNNYPFNNSNYSNNYPPNNSNYSNNSSPKGKYKNPVLVQSTRADVLSGLQYVPESSRSRFKCQWRNKLTSKNWSKNKKAKSKHSFLKCPLYRPLLEGVFQI